MQYDLALFFTPVNIMRTDAGFVIPPSPTANGTVSPLQARQADEVTMWGSAAGAGTKDGWPHLFFLTIPEFEKVECD